MPPIPFNQNTSSKTHITIHHPYLLIAVRSILAAASLLNIPIPLTQTYSLRRDPIPLQWVLTVLRNSTINHNSLSTKTTHRKLCFAIDIKLHLSRPRKSPLFSCETLHALGTIDEPLPTFYNQVHLINFYPHITHNLQHHLTYLIHAYKQFTQIAYFNLFSNFLFIISSTKHNFCSHIGQL